MRVRSASVVPAMVTAALFLIVAAWTNPALAFKEAKRCPGPIDESIVESADCIVFKMNPKGEVTFFNDFAQKYFGYQEKEIVGKDALGTFIPKIDSSGKDLHPMLEDLFRNPGRHVTNQNENVRRNGEKVWISWVNLPITDKSGKVKELLCIGNVISEKK